MEEKKVKKMVSKKVGDVFVVKHILGETAQDLLEDLGDGKYRLLTDAWCIGETCSGGFYHLRQVVIARPGNLTNKMRFWPRLRSALHAAGVKPINVPGGANPVHHTDEIAVPDFSESGTHWFIVKKKDLEKLLENFPLDARGIKRREEIQAAAEAAAAREREPRFIARNIGDKLFRKSSSALYGAEFVRIMLTNNDGSKRSIIYPQYATDLLWSVGHADTARVLCESPEAGIDFLDAKRAGKIKPGQHGRIKKSYCAGWGCEVAYLMPHPDLADEVRNHCRWLSLFDTDDNDGFDPVLIATARKVIVEGFDLYDDLTNRRLLYVASKKEVYVEERHPGSDPEWRRIDA